MVLQWHQILILKRYEKLAWLQIQCGICFYWAEFVLWALLAELQRENLILKRFYLSRGYGIIEIILTYV